MIPCSSGKHRIQKYMSLYISSHQVVSYVQQVFEKSFIIEEREVWGRTLENDRHRPCHILFLKK